MISCVYLIIDYARVRHCSARSSSESQCTTPQKPVERKIDSKLAAVPLPESYGQPIAETHPHIVKPGEIVPGITVNEFKHRREMLMDKIHRDSISLAKKIPNHIVRNPIKYCSPINFLSLS